MITKSNMCRIVQPTSIHFALQTMLAWAGSVGSQENVSSSPNHQHTWYKNTNIGDTRACKIFTMLQIELYRCWKGVQIVLHTCTHGRRWSSCRARVRQGPTCLVALSTAIMTTTVSVQETRQTRKRVEWHLWNQCEGFVRNRICYNVASESDQPFPSWVSLQHNQITHHISQ